MSTLIARMRFGRNNNLSSVGNANAAVCKETQKHEMNKGHYKKHHFTKTQAPKPLKQGITNLRNTQRKVTERIPSLTR